MVMKTLEPSKQWAKRYEVVGDSGTPYVVAQNADGNWACSCPAWVNCKAPKKPCKHVLRLLLQVTSPAERAGALMGQLSTLPESKRKAIAKMTVREITPLEQGRRFRFEEE